MLKLTVVAAVALARRRRNGLGRRLGHRRRLAAAARRSADGSTGTRDAHVKQHGRARRFDDLTPPIRSGAGTAAARRSTFAAHADRQARRVIRPRVVFPSDGVALGS